MSYQQIVSDAVRCHLHTGGKITAPEVCILVCAQNDPNECLLVEVVHRQACKLTVLFNVVVCAKVLDQAAEQAGLDPNFPASALLRSGQAASRASTL